MAQSYAGAVVMQHRLVKIEGKPFDVPHGCRVRRRPRRVLRHLVILRERETARPTLSVLRGAAPYAGREAVPAERHGLARSIERDSTPLSDHYGYVASSSGICGRRACVRIRDS